MIMENKILEQILYQCQARNTLSFSFYLLRHRILEFLNAFVKTMKGVNNEHYVINDIKNISEQLKAEGEQKTK